MADSRGKGKGKGKAPPPPPDDDINVFSNPRLLSVSRMKEHLDYYHIPYNSTDKKKLSGIYKEQLSRFAHQPDKLERLRDGSAAATPAASPAAKGKGKGKAKGKAKAGPSPSAASKKRKAASQITPDSLREMCIIDCDPGVDDALALLAALSPVTNRKTQGTELDILGLTIVHGNLNDVEALGVNAKRILQLADRTDLPVYLGAEKPLVRKKHSGAQFVHGQDGLGDLKFDDACDFEFEDISAAEFIVKMCRQHPNEVSIVALGPFTNVAIALSLEPDLPALAKQFICMGGAVQAPGNISELAEANVFHDPEAAEMCFTAAWTVVMTPLNVTHQFTLTKKDLDSMATDTVGTFIRDVCQVYLKFHKETLGMAGMYVHDPCAILYLLAPELFTESVTCCVNVECKGDYTSGVCIADLGFEKKAKHSRRFKRPPNVKVLMDIDALRALKLLKARWQSYPD